MTTDLDIVEEPLLGTAQWMPPAKVADRYIFEDGDLWLGRNGDDERTPIGRKDDSHVLLCAKTRSGKGRALITNNLLLWPGSLFVNDPKGENASITAARRGQGSDYAKESLGQKVCVLDSHQTATVDDAYRAYYNPIAEIRLDDPDAETKAALIAESCVSSENKNDVTWDNKAKTFIKALVLHVASDRFIPDDMRNLVTLRRFILAGDFIALEHIEAHADPEKLKSDPPDSFMLLLDAMKENKSFYGIISDQARSLMESYANQAKMWNSIRTTAEEHTDWIDDNRMRAVLQPGTYAQSFTANELQSRAGGISVFVCLPSGMKKRFAAWPRILVNMILAAAQSTANRHPATGHQTLMMLDEFASMERMEKIETAAADIAGAGVKMFFVVQSLTQLKAVYGDGWEAFASAADTHIYYGFNDNFTAEYVSKRLGEVEVIRTTRSQSTADNTSTSSADMTGGSRSTAESRSTAYNTSTANARGGGSGTTSGGSSGSSDTTGWGPSILFRTLETTNQHARNSGRNWGTSRQENYQRTKTKGKTKTRGTTTTDGENWSSTRTHTEGQTRTHGTQQGIHKKPLAAINELMRLFGDIEDQDDPAYPGIGLISTASGDPMLIHKSHYDQDRFFEALFDPHPKHGFKSIPALMAPKDQFPVIRDFIGHQAVIERIAISGSTGRMVSCDSDGRMISWDTHSGQIICRIQQYSDDIAFSPDGKKLAVLKYNEVSILNANNLDPIKTFTVCNNRGNSVDFSHDGELIVIGSGESGEGDYRARVFSINDGKLLSDLHHAGSVFTARFFDKSSLVFTGSVYDSGRIWKSKRAESKVSGFLRKNLGVSLSIEPEIQFEEFDGGVFSCDLFEGLSIVATGPAAHGHHPNVIRILNLENGEEIDTLEGHMRRVDSVNFSSDGRFLASSSQDYTIRVWDVGSKQQIRLIDLTKQYGDIDYSRGIIARFLPSTNHLVTSWEGSILRLWNLQI